MTTTLPSADELQDAAAKLGLTDLTNAQLMQLLTSTIAESGDAPTEFVRTFPYRPLDGAHALAKVINETFVFTTGKPIETLFGDEPPEMRSVEISPTKTVTVPWGCLEVPSLDKAQIYTSSTPHRDYGRIFRLIVRAKRKYADTIQTFFQQVEQQLRTHSIYRGKAIIGHNESGFMDLQSFDPRSIVYSDHVKEMLECTLWSTIRYTDALRQDGLSRKRAILLYGPYGTGKTLTGRLTAQIAVDNGWTFIASRPEDTLTDLLRTARIYQPAVVFHEDIDHAASTADDDEVAELLDVFDGLSAKDSELIVVMTTNHIQRIHRGMLRPGRLDALIEIAGLDRNGVERLTKVTAADGKLADDIDYNIVYDSMRDFYPAFVTECVSRASSTALARAGGDRDYRIDTRALVLAAESLLPQLQYMLAAREGEPKPLLEGAFRRALTGARAVDLASGDAEYELDFCPNGKN